MKQGSRTQTLTMPTPRQIPPRHSLKPVFRCAVLVVFWLWALLPCAGAHGQTTAWPNTPGQIQQSSTQSRSSNSALTGNTTRLASPTSSEGTFAENLPFVNSADGRTEADWTAIGSGQPFQSGEPGEGVTVNDMSNMFGGGPEQWTSPKGMSSSIQILILLTVLSLAPSILLMTTCFVRVIVVLGLLRQAIGAQQLPPSQVITALSIFITILVMYPVWQEVKNEAIDPYTTQSQGAITLEETINRGVRPLKRFMIRQISMAENTNDIWLFFRYLPEEEQTPPETWNDVPFKVLLPAFMISELKISFLLGFQVYLPFLVIDLVVSSIAISMGMMMLPPVIISLPFKLILFVLVDGWHLVVGMLMNSFAPYS